MSQKRQFDTSLANKKFEYPIASLANKKFEYPIASLSNKKFEYPIASLSNKKFGYPIAPWTKPWLDMGGNGPPNFFFKYIIYIYGY